MPTMSRERTLPWPDVPPDMGAPADFLLLTALLALAPSLLPLGDQGASPRGERSSTSAPDCLLCLAMESGDLQQPSITNSQAMSPGGVHCWESTVAIAMKYA
jgi:hypothetical protein